eukprot:187742_1
MADAHRLELLSNDEPQNVIPINEPIQESNNLLSLFYFQTSSRITDPIDTSTFCHLHCRKQMCGIISIIFFIIGGYVTLKMGYFMIGCLFVILSILIMLYACTVGYVCCSCFQKTRYDIRFNEQNKIVEVWSSSNKLFAEQEIPYGHVTKFKMETIEQQRVVYGNVIKGSYEECAVIYVVTKTNILVRINKYFAIGDEIEHARHMIEQLNKYWLTDRFCRQLNQ